MVGRRREEVTGGGGTSLGDPDAVQPSGFHERQQGALRFSFGSRSATMKDMTRYKQKLAAVSRLWAKANYDAALGEVETLLAEWPGNSHLHVLWASLVQLQEEPRHGLDYARQALKRAPASLVLGFLAAGRTPAEIIGEFPDLTPDQIGACLDYARDLAEFEVAV